MITMMRLAWNNLICKMSYALVYCWFFLTFQSLLISSYYQVNENLKRSTKKHDELQNKVCFLLWILDVRLVIFSFDFPIFVKAWATHPIAQLILMDGFDVIHAVYLEINKSIKLKTKSLHYLPPYCIYQSMVSPYKWELRCWFCSFLFFDAIISFT